MSQKLAKNDITMINKCEDASRFRLTGVSSQLRSEMYGNRAINSWSCGWSSCGILW